MPSRVQDDLKRIQDIDAESKYSMERTILTRPNSLFYFGTRVLIAAVQTVNCYQKRTGIYLDVFMRGMEAGYMLKVRKAGELLL